MPDASEWRDALRKELDTVDARIAELAWAEQRRARVDVQLAALREVRRVDRGRAIAALGHGGRPIAVCGRVLEEAPIRPRHCPGCGVTVVDPRGSSAAEITARLGADRWLARADGLLATEPCRPVRARGRRSLVAVLVVGAVLVCGALLAVSAGVVLASAISLAP